MSPLARAVIVFEKSPRFEAELKRRMSSPQLFVRPCRSGADVVSLSRRAPGSVVVIDLASVAADGWRLLDELAERPFQVSPVAVASRDMEGLEWAAREMGAVAFVTELQGGAALADVCQRLLG
jgi:DNA-binding response OmpR family regulator